MLGFSTHNLTHRQITTCPNRSEQPASEILNAVIDERRKLSSIDDIALIDIGRERAGAYATRHEVFKKYLLDADPFYIDPTLN